MPSSSNSLSKNWCVACSGDVLIPFLKYLSCTEDQNSQTCFDKVSSLRKNLLFAKGFYFILIFLILKIYLLNVFRILNCNCPCWNMFMWIQLIFRSNENSLKCEFAQVRIRSTAIRSSANRSSANFPKNSCTNGRWCNVESLSEKLKITGKWSNLNK